MDVSSKLINRDKKIAIALSGGIDSIIAGWILKHKGFNLTGIYLKLFNKDNNILNVQMAANLLDIPLTILDCRTEFNMQIIKPFIDAYLSGQTPNPCVFCNAIIKCGLLLDWVFQNGIFNLATGHYARIKRDRETGDCFLLRGLDINKDQSYFLHRLTQKQLCHIVFPLGEWSKKDVVDLGRKIGFKQENFRESQEICFLTSNDYRSFLKQDTPDAFKPGPIFDKSGYRIGTHQGLPGYTIGQRKGLDLSHPGPHYVIAIDSEKNQIVVGKDEDLWKTELSSDQINKIVSPWPKKVVAKIRSTQKGQEAEIEEINNGQVKVLFRQPIRAISPGQSVVFYDGDICIGGGIINVNKIL